MVSKVSTGKKKKFYLLSKHVGNPSVLTNTSCTINFRVQLIWCVFNVSAMQTSICDTFRLGIKDTNSELSMDCSVRATYCCVWRAGSEDRRVNQCFQIGHSQMIKDFVLTPSNKQLLALWKWSDSLCTTDNEHHGGKHLHDDSACKVI